MPHLPPGVGVPDGPLSFDHLMVTWMLVQLALVLTVALALRIVPRRYGRRHAAPRSASPKSVRATRGGRRPRRHLRAVV